MESEPLSFLTHEEFPLLSRARKIILSTQTSKGPYVRLDIPDGSRIVVSLTNLGISFCNGNRLTQALEILIDAVRIQECINYPTHPDLLRPLLALGHVYSRQCQFAKAEEALLRALVIAGKTDSNINIIEEHRWVLVNLVGVYNQLIQNYVGKRDEMQRSLVRLDAENPFLIKDRHSRPDE
jgi:hypothetical protein